jgi:hypothetical protein
MPHESMLDFAAFKFTFNIPKSTKILILIFDPNFQNMISQFSKVIMTQLFVDDHLVLSLE